MSRRVLITDISAGALAAARHEMPGTGTFHVTRLAIPHLEQSAAGSVVIMSSLGGPFGYPSRRPYRVSERGLIGFAKTLAIALRGPAADRQWRPPGFVIDSLCHSTGRSA